MIESSQSMNSHTRVDTEPLLVLHYRLAGVAEAGNVANIAHQTLQAAYSHNSSILRFCEIEFDLPNEDDVKLHLRKVADIVEELKR